MKRKKTYQILALSLLILFLFGCTKETSVKDKQEVEKANIEDIDPDGVLTYGVDQSLDQIWLKGFIEQPVAKEASQFIHEDMIVKDENMKWQPNLATYETKDEQTYTFKIKKGIKWHNGEELTMNDWQFALKLWADSEYEGENQYAVENLQGIQAYRDGVTDSLAGFKVKGPYEAEVKFREKRADNLEHLWMSPLPEKELKGVSMKELAENKTLQANPIGLGAFKVVEQTDNELKLERFDDYFKGKPKLKGIVLKEIKSNDVLTALNDAEIDMIPIRHEEAKSVSSIEDMHIEEQSGLGFSYIGFRLGHYNEETEQSVEDFDKYENKLLRQAMYYALDRKALIKQSMDGKANILNTPIPSAFWTHETEGIETYSYDPDKAAKLLDEAGYKDTNDDGLREDLDGKPFKVKFTHYEGPGFKDRAEAIMKYWQAIGIDVELTNEKLVSYKKFNEMKETDDNNLEVFFDAAIQMSTDPSVLWHSTSKWNTTRWSDEKTDKALEEALLTKSSNEKEQKKQYRAFQKRFNKEVPAIPLWENTNLFAVRDNIGKVKLKPTGFKDVHTWFITK